MGSADKKRRFENNNITYIFITHWEKNGENALSQKYFGKRFNDYIFGLNKLEAEI